MAMEGYSYVYIIYEHIEPRKTPPRRNLCAKKYPIKYALRVYGGVSSRVDDILKYQYRDLKPICYFRYDSNGIKIANNVFTKYPRHKCRGLRSRCAPLCNKGFITYIKTNIDFILHIITVEIDYHFGNKLSTTSENFAAFKRYMDISREYFTPLIGVNPTSFQNITAYNYRPLCNVKYKANIRRNRNYA
jgi:hypothetical protein